MKNKMKTKRSAAKRFSFTATGKVKAKPANLRHMLTDKRSKDKRKLSKSMILPESDRRNVERMLPYGNTKTWR